MLVAVQQAGVDVAKIAGFAASVEQVSVVLIASILVMLSRFVPLCIWRQIL